MGKNLTGLLMVIVLLASVRACWATDQTWWGVERIRADLVWNMNRGNGVKIAILDSGVWPEHPDLQGRIIGGESFTGTPWWDDYYGHGTFVAGIIAATINDWGLVGVAPNVSILVAKIEDGYGAIQPQRVIDALYWARAQGAQVVTMSFAMTYNWTVEEALWDLWCSGVFLVAATGNNGGPVDFPASYGCVVAVGAVDENDIRPWWSNYGETVDFLAPGVNINSTVNNYDYSGPYFMIDDGTSYATPHVAATAALVFASKIDSEYDFDNDRRWSNVEVESKLQDTALPIGWSNENGYGLVNSWYSNERPPGDINYDYRVNILDAITVSNAMGSGPGNPRWNRRADINIDNVVNILDAIIVSDNFGRKDP